MNLHLNVFRSVTPCLVAIIAISIPAFAQSNDRDVLRDRIEWLSSASEPTVDGAPIAAVPLISKLCERRDYQPAWTDPEMVRQLYDQVLRSVEHGLDPEDFHDLLYFASCCVTEGATTATEACVLGTPVLYANPVHPECLRK